tara:strand:+ start:1305 stop:1778 length:474 start_codon:yes stop_codon:yes gene_type:complete
MFKITITGGKNIGIDNIVQKYMTKGGCDLHSKMIVCNSNNRFDLGDCDAALFVFDIANRSSFYEINQLYRNFNSYRKANSLCFLVGNNKDNQREVLTKTATEFALNKNMSYCEISTNELNDTTRLFQRVLLKLENVPSNKRQKKQIQLPVSDRCIQQ